MDPGLLAKPKLVLMGRRALTKARDVDWRPGKKLVVGGMVLTVELPNPAEQAKSRRMYNERSNVSVWVVSHVRVPFSQGASGQANDKLASQMVFSLRGIMGSPAKTARLRLMAGKADPANPLSKFLMVLCKQPRGSKEVIARGGYNNRVVFCGRNGVNPAGRLPARCS